MNKTYSEETIQEVWEKAIIVPDFDKDQARHDLCGNVIYRVAYGHYDSKFGWVVNTTQLDESDEVDLKPLHWQNHQTSTNPIIIGDCCNC